MSGVTARATCSMALSTVTWRRSGPIAVLAHVRTRGWLVNPICLHFDGCHQRGALGPRIGVGTQPACGAGAADGITAE
ncbi:MAG: hypothetical protein ABSD78_08180 [Acidimicrobiales bacterium]